MAKDLEVVVITGMSGAGKTVAIQSFEDLGYFCVDNMPPALLPKLLELVNETGKVTKVALVFDLRSQAFYDEIIEMLKTIEDDQGGNAKILFLDATDDELVSRYKETRRSHPLAMDGRVLDGIKKERSILEIIKVQAQLVIDTSDISPRQLREKIFANFDKIKSSPFHVDVMSFGFKYGLPIDADVVMDVRFLPNPYYIPELRNLTGVNQAVADYVMDCQESQDFYEQFLKLLDLVIPGYKKEGKTTVTIAIGCTGGQHRSVALAEKIGHALEAQDYLVHISHRDMNKRKETINRS